MPMSEAVVFVSGTLEVGGSEMKVVRMANALSRRGFDVAIAYLNGPDTLLDRIDSSVEIEFLDRRGKVSVSSLRKLAGFLEGRRASVAAVNFYPLIYTLPAAWLAHAEIRTVSLINTTDFVGNQWVFGPIYAPLIRRCDRVVFGCEAQRTMWTRKYRIPAKKSTVAYNGVDTEYFSEDAISNERGAFRKRHGIPAEAILLGGIGRLAPEKNFSLLLSAFVLLRKQGRPVHLAIVGSGAERSMLEELSIRSGFAEAIHFVGEMSDVRPALSDMDIFVLSSRAVETFSNAALEAMSLSLPVVLSDIGGASEMLDHGQSGYLFENGNLEQLTRILSMLCDSGETRRQVGEAARREVEGRFRFENMLARYEEILFT